MLLEIKQLNAINEGPRFSHLYYACGAGARLAEILAQDTLRVKSVS